MKRHIPLVAILVTAAVFVAACGGGGAAGPAATSGGNVDAGKALFAQSAIGSQPGCGTCHSLDAGETIVGPTMAGIGTAAASKVSGESSEQFLRNSILEPNAYVESGFAEGIMPAYKDALSEQQVNDLVAYLLSLK
jgi:mono/diheme cytochrome c family protein